MAAYSRRSTRRALPRSFCGWRSRSACSTCSSRAWHRRVSGAFWKPARIGSPRDLAEAAKAKEEADAAVAAYETDLATARKNALDIGNKARDAAKAKAEADRKAAEAGLDGMLKSAESRISDLRASGMKEVGKIAEDTASAILTQLTGGKFSASEIANAIKTVKG